ncbi:HAD family acid phosphatase [Virgibacillus sp. C22-A2]|uniref:Nucleotidase n=1 Tax=Virgibacillus tibetensis TaxID=3042313 RepID=A0ABU6KJJ9_9BACI|nr:HAD family acid phosphatase [Virgibacillus sp. C22-A2]
MNLTRDEKMKFGFDIDDTLINLREHAFSLYKQKLNKDLSLDVFHAIKKVEIHEPFGLTEDQGKEMWNSSLEEIYFTTCPPFTGAVETLQELYNQGHEIYYITARPKEHGERTKDWMKQQGFPIQDERFFYGMKDDEKINIIQQLKLDYYVDDKPAVLNTLTGEPVKLIVKDQSYNQDLDMDRIVTWTDFPEIIQGN